MPQVLDMFWLTNKIAVVAGGGGVLGGAIAHAFSQAGAKVAIADLSLEAAQRVAEDVVSAGGIAKGYAMNCMDLGSIKAACEAIHTDFGKVDILLNAVGGNMADATASPGKTYFDLSIEALGKVVDLNLVSGIMAPCQVFGAHMKDNPDGASIINIASMTSTLPLTRVVGYSAAKAGVANFTKWLAAHLAQEFGPKIRVNALAPGFFLTEQNRFLLTDKDTGALTERGKQIIDHTPMAQFGAPEDLAGVSVWLASDGARFVTGAVIPIDGGFSAYWGV